jgi:phage gp29-like protein
MAPWQNGLWRAIGRAYIRKEHASLHCDNWEAKLANPARVAVAPTGGVEAQKDSFFRQVMAWGVNTVFSLSPGYDVKLLESNGRGFESFKATIKDQNQEIIITIAGQTVTTDGGTGFANADVHKSIRADLIKATADGLAYTLNTQGLPAFVLVRFGESALVRSVVVEWDVTPPKDRTAEASSLVTIATAITTLNEALQAHGRRLDVATICARFNVPILGDADGDGTPDAAEAEPPEPTLTEPPSPAPTPIREAA